MVQRGDGSCFPLETLVEIVVRDLNRDDPFQTCVASLPHFAHPTGAETRQDFVRPEFVACGEWYGRKPQFYWFEGFGFVASRDLVRKSSGMGDAGMYRHTIEPASAKEIAHE